MKGLAGLRRDLELAREEEAILERLLAHVQDEIMSTRIHIYLEEQADASHADLPLFPVSPASRFDSQEWADALNDQEFLVAFG